MILDKKSKNNKQSDNKKGLGYPELMATIIGLVVLIIVVVIAVKVYSSSKENLEVQSCHDSIAAHTLFATASANQIFTDIKCPTRQITIDNSDLKAAKSALAEDMKRCWYEWGAGKYQLFKGKGIFCHVCAIYDFKEKDNPIDGFMYYLSMTSMTSKYGVSNPGKITYQDYLQGFATPNSAQKIKDAKIEDLAKIDTVDTNKKYMTLFVYASGKDNIDVLLEGGNRLALGTGGGVSVLLGLASGGVAVGAVSGFIAGTAANIWNPIGWVGVTVLLVGGGAYAIYMAVTPKPPEWVSFLAFRPFDSTEIANLKCQELPVNQQSNSKP